MFEKSLTDLIRGIRANKRNEEKYIAQCLDEIRQEVKRNDVDIKANAVAKLAYLHTMGYSMNWASFHVVEVMSSPKFVNKRIGYAAAAQTFRKDTDVLMLVTNLIKKDMSSNSYLEAAQGLHGLAHIVNADLGRDLLPDLMIMLNHSRPYIRKRVILVLFRVFSMYPDALKIAFPRLREKLDDPDPSVVSAAVNVICELARMNPKSYLPLAPQLYGLLTNSSNNWMLIKIVKLFAALTPFEPRLAKKLAPSITNLIQTTTAMSLLFECIQTVITGGMISKDGQDSDDAEALLVKLCVSKLQLFVVHQDQNLKYLGLHALGKLQPLRPSVVLEHKTVIIQCLEDSDISIRQRALDLICGMVTKETLIPTTNRLMKHIDTPKVWSADVGATPAQNVRTASQPNTAFDATYRSEVVERILKICSADMYANVGNFDWYIRVLADLAHTPGISVSSKIGDQLMEVVARVPQVRPTAVAVLSKLLYELPPVAPSSSNASTSVLFSIAYILGEHSSLLSDALETLKNLMHRDNVKLDAHVQSTYLQSILKIVVSVARAEDWETVAEVVSSAIACLLRFEMTADLEVQERAAEAHKLLELLKADYDHVRTELPQLFDGALNPVAPKAQKKVPVPEGLLLDVPIYDSPDFVPPKSEPSPAKDADFLKEFYQTPTSKKDQLFYLPSNSTTRGKDAEIDQIPIATLDFDLPGTRMPIPEVPTFTVYTGLDVPEGVDSLSSDEEKNEPEVLDLQLDIALNRQTVPAPSQPSPKPKAKPPKKKRKEKKVTQKSNISRVALKSKALRINHQWSIVNDDSEDIQVAISLKLESLDQDGEFKITLISDALELEQNSATLNLNQNVPTEHKFTGSLKPWECRESLLTVYAKVEKDIEITDFKFSPPAHIFMRQPRTLQMSSDSFADLLANDAELRRATATATLILSGTNVVRSVGELVATILCMTIVEEIAGAASLYGLTMHGTPVAGLLKMQNGNGQVSVSVELKSHRKWLIDRMLEDVHLWSKK